MKNRDNLAGVHQRALARYRGALRALMDEPRDIANGREFGALLRLIAETNEQLAKLEL
jgi:hypothetical protein